MKPVCILYFAILLLGFVMGERNSKPRNIVYLHITPTTVNYKFQKRVIDRQHADNN